MSATAMSKRTAAGTLALAICLGGGAIALAGALRADQPTWYHDPAGTQQHQQDEHDEQGAQR